MLPATPRSRALVADAADAAGADSRVSGGGRSLLLFALLAAPLAFGSVPAWAWGLLGAVVATVLFWWAMASARRKLLQVHWSPLLLPGLFFLGVVLFQWSTGLTADEWATRDAFLQHLTGFLIFFLACQFLCPASEDFWKRLAWLVAAYAFVLSVFGILQFLSARDRIYWLITARDPGWVFGPYVNHNHYAGLMELLIPIAFVFMLSRPLRYPARPLLAFAVLVAFASVLLSGSRGGFIALLAEILLLAVILVRLWPRSGRRALVTPLVVALVGATLLFVWMDPGGLAKRLTTALFAHPQESTLADRLQVAGDSLSIVKDYPWLGIGLGSYKVVFPRYRSVPGDPMWDHAHNDYVEYLVETGLVGGLILLAGLALWLYLAFRKLRHRLGNEVGWIQLGAALGCCGLLVHSLVDFNLHIPANAAWFAFCAALAVAHSPGSKRAPTVVMQEAD